MAPLKKANAYIGGAARCSIILPPQAEFFLCGDPQPNLQLLFFNGCSTLGQAEAYKLHPVLKGVLLEKLALATGLTLDKFGVQ